MSTHKLLFTGVSTIKNPNYLCWYSRG